MNASPSTTPRKWRRSATMSCCTAEKMPGVTLETRALMRSTGIVAISQPSVYAPSDCVPTTRPTTATSAAL